jgi:hypothetical protein
MGLAAVITSATTYLYMWYYNLQADELAKLRALNFPESGLYVALGYDQYMETGQCTNNATTINIYPQCQYASFCTHIFLKDRTYN